MKDTNLKPGSIFGYITALIIAAMLCGTAIFVSMQYSQAQKDIADTHAQAMKDSADKQSKSLESASEKIGKGLTDIGWYGR